MSDNTRNMTIERDTRRCHDPAFTQHDIPRIHDDAGKGTCKREIRKPSLPAIIRSGDFAALHSFLNEIGVRGEDAQGDLSFALQCAIMQESGVAVIELLVSHTDVNIVGDDCNTPLYLAAQSGRLDIVKALLRAGADPDIVCECKNTPLYIACKYGHEAVVSELIGGGTAVNVVCQDDSTPLCACATHGDVNMVKKLIQSGAEVNVVCENKNTPLFVATMHDHAAVAKELIEAGAAVNVRCQDGLTPLLVCCERDLISVMEVLLEGGADANLSFEGGTSPLRVALQCGKCIGTVELLVRYGANVNAFCNKRIAPLYCACLNRRAKCAKLLLEAGANVDALCVDGRTALYACCSSHDDNGDVVKVLLQGGANVNFRYGNENTPMFAAIRAQRPFLVHQLLAAGANPNAVCEHGLTPFFCAPSLCTVTDTWDSILRSMMNAGADMEGRMPNGMTLLLRCLGGGFRGYYGTRFSDVIRMLLEWGCSPGSLAMARRSTRIRVGMRGVYRGCFSPAERSSTPSAWQHASFPLSDARVGWSFWSH